MRRRPATDQESEKPTAADSLELAIVGPTFNEVDNVEELVHRLDQVLDGRAWEVIFVDDDSGDGTADAVRRLSRTDRRVRCLQRIGRRGLNSGTLWAGSGLCGIAVGAVWNYAVTSVYTWKAKR